jgi:hypothetical protein
MSSVFEASSTGGQKGCAQPGGGASYVVRLLVYQQADERDQSDGLPKTGKK